MKKTISISLGKRAFIFDEDAYALIKTFFDNYTKELRFSENASSASEIVEDVEMRMADLFQEKLAGGEVVGIALAKEVIAGMGFSVPETATCDASVNEPAPKGGKTGPRRVFRDMEHKMLGGVCSGLSLHLDVDVVLLRVIFVLATIFGLAGFWIYLVFWIVVPEAKTPVEKCEMNGESATAENIRKYS